MRAIEGNLIRTRYLAARDYHHSRRRIVVGMTGPNCTGADIDRAPALLDRLEASGSKHIVDGALYAQWESLDARA